MAEARIEVEQVFEDPQHGHAMRRKLDIRDLRIKVYDGDKLVAESTIESMVKKFLVVSSEYAQAMMLLGVLQQKTQGNRVVVAKEEQVEAVKKQVDDFKTRQDG